MQPGSHKQWSQIMIKFIFVVGIIGVGIFVAVKTMTITSTTTETAAVAEKPKLPPPATDEKISTEYARQVWHDAALKCTEALAERADYGFRISRTVMGMRMLSPQLDQFNSYQQPDGSMSFRGEDIEVQNRFNEWINGHYFCKWDTQSKRVLKVTLGVGRLPKLSSSQ
jgi:hypothetical protein